MAVNMVAGRIYLKGFYLKNCLCVVEWMFSGSHLWKYFVVVLNMLHRIIVNGPEVCVMNQVSKHVEKIFWSLWHTIRRLTVHAKLDKTIFSVICMDKFYRKYVKISPLYWEMFSFRAHFLSFQTNCGGKSDIDSGKIKNLENQKKARFYLN